MNITVSGATGFIGTRLLAKLKDLGHAVHTIGRRPIQGLRFSDWNMLEGPPPEDSLCMADAIIHLAGEPVAQRWTPEIKHRIVDSRQKGTRHLVHGISTLSRRPKTLICASAIGIYGPRGDEILTESSAPGQGFLAETTVAWEKEADMAESLGLRVVKLRTGVVLGKDGGALETMLPPFRAGVGGKLASGKQWMSWIHIDDVVNLIVFALKNEKIRGALNTTAPNPVTNAEFTEDLGKAIHRPTVMPVPEFALKMMYGEMAQVILESQRVIPEAALNAGYPFLHPDLPEALATVV